MDMGKLLSDRFRMLHSDFSFIREPSQEAHKETEKCLFVKQGHYAQLIARLEKAKIIEQVGEGPTDFKGFSRAPKEKR